MLGASSRQKEMITAGLGAVIILCLLYASGSSIKPLNIPAWLNHQFVSGRGNSATPRPKIINQRAGNSLYARVKEVRKQHKRSRDKAIRSSVLSIRASSGMNLPVPGARFYGVRFNQLGWRGPEPPAQVAGNTIVIAYLGSSITLDKQAIPDSKSWPGLTTRRLQQHFPDCRFVYQNTGVQGLSSRSLKKFYTREVLTKLRPDVVIVMTDDRKIRFREMGQAAATAGARPRHLDLKREQLLQHYAEDLPALLTTIKSHNAVPVLLSFGQQLGRGQSYIEQRRARGAGPGAPPSFISLQGLLQSAEWYNEMNRETAAALGVPFIEWHRQLQGTQRNYLDLRHFQPAGSALMAEILARQMMQSALFLSAMAEKNPCAATSQDT
jgi:hypothetical protein